MNNAIYYMLMIDAAGERALQVQPEVPSDVALLDKCSSDADVVFTDDEYGRLTYLTQNARNKNALYQQL